jgi:hypothetical protein
MAKRKKKFGVLQIIGSRKRHIPDKRAGSSKSTFKSETDADELEQDSNTGIQNAQEVEEEVKEALVMAECSPSIPSVEGEFRYRNY